ncbi:MAG: hypothetical protein ABI378_03795, partial [Chitinophagaceae bacterium]
NDSNVTIERCYVNAPIVFGNGANIDCDHDTVRQCVLTSSITCQPSGGTFSAMGEMVYNNIFDAGIDFTTNLSKTSGYFINNDFLYPANFSLQNGVFQNNIFYSPTFAAYGTSNYFANNIVSTTSAASDIDTGNSNQFSISPAAVYVNTNAYPYNSFGTPPAGLSHDGQFQLLSSSPAIGAGFLNSVTVDCGAFGGAAPYVLSGMPDIPSIYSLTVPKQLSNGTINMSISLSAASH